MITAFNAYKAKQLKGKTTRQKTVETPGVIIDWVTKTTTKLQTQNSKLSTQNYSDWTEEDQISYQTALTGLKTEIETYLFSLLK